MGSKLTEFFFAICKMMGLVLASIYQKRPVSSILLYSLLDEGVSFNILTTSPKIFLSYRIFFGNL
jgi:hypothetical protein